VLEDTAWSTSLFRQGFLHVSPSLLLVRSNLKLTQLVFRRKLLEEPCHIDVNGLMHGTGGNGTVCYENARCFTSFQLDKRRLRFWVTALENQQSPTHSSFQRIPWGLWQLLWSPFPCWQIPSYLGTNSLALSLLYFLRVL